MGRRIWRRPTHPSRLRVIYDLGMLCVKFNDIQVYSALFTYLDLFKKHSRQYYRINLKK